MPIQTLYCPKCKEVDLKFIPGGIDLENYTYRCGYCNQKTKMADVITFSDYYKETKPINFAVKKIIDKRRIKDGEIDV